MNKNNGSVSALIESGRGGKARSGSRFSHRDDVLKGFYAMPGCTVNEVSVEYFDWMRERYKNASKRAVDLVKIGYLKQLDNRTCRFSGRSCHAFEITAKGIEYLRVNRKLPAVKPVVDPVLAVKTKVRPDFSSMKGGLSV